MEMRTIRVTAIAYLGLFAAGLGLGAWGMAQFRAHSTPEPSKGADRQCVEASKLGGETAAGEKSNNSVETSLPPGYQPSADLVGALRAQAAKFTQEERLAELRRLRGLKPGQDQSVSSYSGNNVGMLRHLALILPEDIPVLIAEIETLVKAKKEPGHTYESALFRSWATADAEGMEAWMRSGGAEGLREEAATALSLYYAEVGGVTGWDKMVSASKIRSPEEEFSSWNISLIQLVGRPDPRGIYERAMKIEKESSRTWAASDALKLMAKAGDFRGAMELAQKEEPGTLLTMETSVMISYLDSAKPDRAEMLRYFIGKGREDLVASVKSSWAIHDEAGYQAWQRAHPEEEVITPPNTDKLNDELGAVAPSERFAKTLEMKNAAVSTTDAEKQFFAEALKNNATQLAQVHPQKALRTLATLTEEQRSECGPPMVTSLAAYDPQLAQQALGKIPDHSARFKAMRSLATAWASYDPDAANAWVGQQEKALPEKDFADLQAALKEKAAVNEEEDW